MNNTNNFSARQSYQRAKEIYFNAWINTKTFNGDAKACQDYIDSLKLSQGELRLEVALTAVNNQFRFAVTNDQNNTTNVRFPTEQRLPLQDTLVANEYGIFIAATSGNNDTNYRINTYPNTQQFAAADIAPLNALYANGSFAIVCNKDVIVPYRGMLNHLYRPQTQQTAALGAGSPDDQLRGSEDGYITLEPNILLIGSKGYEPVINLPANIAIVTANLRAILILKGVYAQNSTSVS